MSACRRHPRYLYSESCRAIDFDLSIWRASLDYTHRGGGYLVSSTNASIQLKPRCTDSTRTWIFMRISHAGWKPFGRAARNRHCSATGFQTSRDIFLYTKSTSAARYARQDFRWLYQLWRNNRAIFVVELVENWICKEVTVRFISRNAKNVKRSRINYSCVV